MRTGVAAGGDGAGLGSEFFHQPFDHAVDCAERPIVKAGLHAGDRVGADDSGGFFEIDQRQAGGAAEKRFRGDADAGGDDAAEVFGVGGDGVEGDGGAEIDDDAGAAVFVERGDAVDDAVGADFRRVIVEDGETGAGLGGYEHRRRL